MGVIIGSARVDERGKYTGGTGGDQKQSSTPDYKGEVSMQDFYVHSKGWYVFIPKSTEVGKKIAQNMIDACNNSYLGYSQSDRYGVIKYGVHTITKTNCDCSSLVRACIKEATGKDPGDFNTSSEPDVLAKTGLFETKKSYTNGMSLPSGTVLVTKTKGHTVIVTNGNDKVESNTPSSPTKIMNGIDVSRWQKGINLKNIDADFVILKASQGTAKKDECLDSFAKQVLDSGKLLGLYHFADGKSSGKAEAEWFLKCVAPYVGKAVLILDLEADALKKNTNYALEFMRTVKKNANATPVLYCSTNVTREKDWSVFIKEFPMLWGAKYGKNPVRNGYIKEKINDGENLKGFTEIMRQYSSKTHLTGWSGDLDANIFYGEKKDWVWLSNGTVEQGIASQPQQSVTPRTTTTPSSTTSGQKYMVTASALNYRKGPGTYYAIVGVIHKNEVYTITETKNGWGKLKSGSGWVFMSYMKKV